MTYCIFKGFQEKRIFNLKIIKAYYSHLKKLESYLFHTDLCITYRNLSLNNALNFHEGPYYLQDVSKLCVSVSKVKVTGAVQVMG